MGFGEFLIILLDLDYLVMVIAVPVDRLTTHLVIVTLILHQLPERFHFAIHPLYHLPLN